MNIGPRKERERGKTRKKKRKERERIRERGRQGKSNKKREEKEDDRSQEKWDLDSKVYPVLSIDIHHSSPESLMKDSSVVR